MKYKYRNPDVEAVRKKNKRQRKLEPVIRALVEKKRIKFANSDPFYSSIQWRLLRAQVLCMQRECKYCGSYSRLQVDHIKPRCRYPELSLELSNLQVLCERCNLRKGTR